MKNKMFRIESNIPKNINKTILVVILYLIFNYNLEAQDAIIEVREDEKTEIGEECQLVKKDIKNIISNFLIELQQVSTFIDRNIPEGELNKVTDRSQEAFTAKFAYSSRIYNDLLLYPVTVSPQDYAAFIANYYHEGLKSSEVFITDIYLKNIGYNKEAEKYEVFLKVKKLLYTAYDEDKKKVKAFKVGRLHELDMSIDIPENLDASKTEILSIIGPHIERKKSKPSWLGVGLQLDYCRPELTPLNITNGSSLKAIPGLGGGISAVYYKVLSRKKKSHALVLGGSAQVLGYSLDGNGAKVSFPETRLISNGIQGTHEFVWESKSNNSIKMVSGLAGISVVVSQTYRRSLGIGIYVQPYYLLNSNPKTTTIRLIQRADGIEWCNQSIEYNTQNKSFGIAGVFSPFYQKDINDSGTKFLRVNLDISYSFLNLVESYFDNPNPSQLEGTNNDIPKFVNPSKSNIFYSSFKPHYAGLRIEYLFKTNKKK